MSYALLETTTPDEFSFKATNLIAAHLRFMTKEQARVIVGLSGGSTPKPIYNALALEPDIDWTRVWLFLVDDRYVPADSPDSNQKLVLETILKNAPIPEEQLLFPDTSLPLEQCVEQYDRRLSTLFRRGTPDIVTLGMGDDGHIASLFPPVTGDAFLPGKSAIHTTTDRFAIHDRISVTLPILQSAKVPVFLIKGADKRIVWDEMIAAKENPRRWPAQLVLEEGRATAVMGA